VRKKPDMSHDKRKDPRIDFYLPVTIKGQQGLKKNREKLYA
jgi:hypothetical protein